MVEKIIELLVRLLPFEISSNEAFNTLISAVDDEDLEEGLRDISRELFFRHEIEFYVVETDATVNIAPNTPTEIATPSFKEEKSGIGGDVFETNKKEWIKKVIKGIVNSIISNVVERYGTRFGTNNAPGENIGSVDWLIRVLRMTLMEEKIRCILSPGQRSNIEVMLREIRDNLDNIEYVLDQEEKINRILEVNNCTREDIIDLIRRYRLENARISGRLLFEKE